MMGGDIRVNTSVMRNPHISKFHCYNVAMPLSPVLPTGCKAIDQLLGGGIHYGMITDIYGESGTGKSQLCFTICARNAEFFENSQQASVVFIDAGGTFRPERIVAIANTRKEHEILDKILVKRSFSSTDQIDSINSLVNFSPRLLIIDDVASLFATEYVGAARHLALMKHLHELSIIAINLRCAVVITNAIRSARNEAIIRNPMMRTEKTQRFIETKREFMGTSMSIYAHMRLMLKFASKDKSIFKAVLLQPSKKHEAYYTITENGVTDIT